MTYEQFIALVALTSLRHTKALECARMVLVDGTKPSVAADKSGVTRQQVSQTVVRPVSYTNLTLTTTPPVYNHVVAVT